MSAAPDLKRVTLELGGNDPAIVLDDADPAAVASAIFAGAFNNNGQVCSAIKRVYVPEALYDDVVEGLAAHARAIKVGEGTEEGVKLGPINNEPQYERVKELVADALSHGATAVTGGKAMDRPGYFFEPTILTGLSDGTRIVDEEQFGPALPVIPYRDLGDAIDRANATHFGLSGLGVERRRRPGASRWRPSSSAARRGSTRTSRWRPSSPSAASSGAASAWRTGRGDWPSSPSSRSCTAPRRPTGSTSTRPSLTVADAAPSGRRSGWRCELVAGGATVASAVVADLMAAPAPGRALQVLRDLLTSARPFWIAPSAVCSEDVAGDSRSWSAFHWAGVKASTVAARPLVALVAAPIWLLRSSMSGSSCAWFCGFTCACALESPRSAPGWPWSWRGRRRRRSGAPGARGR